jgi:hypothetical protein
MRAAAFTLAAMIGTPWLAFSQMVTEMHVTACVTQPGQAFTLTLYQSCPPPGEAPPPHHCDGGTTAYLKSDDARAALPGPVVLRPNAFVTTGSITLHTRGRRIITVYAQDDDSMMGQIACTVGGR